VWVSAPPPLHVVEEPGGSCAAVDLPAAPPKNEVVEKFNSSRGGDMATVNFSVPDEVKREFDKAFAGRNKSRTIAELMMRAVEEQRIRKRRAEAIEALLARRRTRRPVSDGAARRARRAGRP
jgi:hypothetical protein